MRVAVVLVLVLFCLKSMDCQVAADRRTSERGDDRQGNQPTNRRAFFPGGSARNETERSMFLGVRPFDPWLTRAMTAEMSFPVPPGEASAGSVNSRVAVMDSRGRDRQLSPALAYSPSAPLRQESHQPAVDAGVQGSWGSWAVWGECSRSCGGGVQQRTRPCLPSYTHPAASYPHVLDAHKGRLAQGHVISALRPSVPLHRNADQLPDAQGGRGDLAELRPGRRRIHNPGSPIGPGTYGYGKMPYVLPLQRDTAQDQRPVRQQRFRRSNPREQSRRPLSQLYSQRKTPHTHAAWVSLHQPGSTRHHHQQEEGHHNRNQAPRPNRDRPYSPLPDTSCLGLPNQYRMCNNKPCPAASRHIREIQCSSYNSRPFMGRLYEWEPFNEVPGDQHCQLNCRAVGYRFYVRQADRVMDGTPCGQNDSAVCVAGRCQTPGCDELLGSEKVVDKCGVCGGDNSTCKLVSGLFQHSLSKMGYHKIVEIPEGATKINVTEVVKSRNYLALRSRSGRSIINGNWAIDRPGKYEGVGTMFTYRRPNEISSTAGESFLAEGPTNEILDVYMIYQQPNPAVHYEFILPAERAVGSPFPTDHRPEGNTVNDRVEPAYPAGTNQQERNQAGRGRYSPRVPDNQVPVAQPPQRQREYNWKLTGSTECSASCGKGSRYTIFKCVQRASHMEVSDSLCDHNSKPNSQEEPCNVQPCPAFWDIGEWSECSKTCGLGMQHRQVLCRQVYANRTLNVHTSRCQHLERPEATSTCQMKICSEWQIRSEWTPCSVPCGVGQRTREVHCVSNVGDIVPDEECNMKLRPSDVENCDMGACAKSWFFTEWGSRCSAECGMGVRTRSVLCLNNHISSLPLEGCGPERPQEAEACNNGPCESRIEWFTGPWSQCSAECGAGTQQRAVACLMKSEDGFTVMPPYECSSLERPLSQQSCHIEACGAKWYHTDWSSCSKSCEGGFRVREVRCLSDDLTSSEGCEERLKPAEREECNPEPCVPQIDENCRDKYFNCNVVVQARLCVYNYYRMACCASCAQKAQRRSGKTGHR
ncbi:thrombospondin type-1 domain-containing protein 4 [Chanos chanos]|uniref:Thrombospondin type-1 domain-containing protein 4 n=1 Tax=Chanos chanos TaxID=29144 RepID=A0A6J2WYS2_CHACN|nr:thrombospondin type-1 domain-containing protein 4 [Chanos chanos]